MLMLMGLEVGCNVVAASPVTPSRSPNAAAQPQQRLLQFGVGNRGQAILDRTRLIGPDRRRRAARAGARARFRPRLLCCSRFSFPRSMPTRSAVPTETPMPLDPAGPRPDPEPLLAWYDRHRRDLSWRSPPGRSPDPYR